MIQALLLAGVAFVGKRVLIGDQATGQGGVGGLFGMLLLFYGSPPGSRWSVWTQSASCTCVRRRSGSGRDSRGRFTT